MRIRWKKLAALGLLGLLGLLLSRPVAAGSPAAPAAGEAGHARVFAGGQALSAQAPEGGLDWHTLELWVRPSPAAQSSTVAASMARYWDDYWEEPLAYGWQLRLVDGQVALDLHDPFGQTVVHPARLAADSWHHLAMVASPSQAGATLVLWVDGQPAPGVEIATWVPFLRELWLGGGDAGGGYVGAIDELRVSRSARYAEPFVPGAPLDGDAATLALYRFDEGSGVLSHDVLARWPSLAGPAGWEVSSLPSRRAAPARAHVPWATRAP